MLPETDRPELLFLPRNIMLSWDLAQSDAAIAKLRQLFTAAAFSHSIDPEKAFSGGQFPRQLWLDTLGPVLTLWKKLNQQSPQLLQIAAEEQKQRPISAGNRTAGADQTKKGKAFGFKIFIFSGKKAINHC